MKDTQTLLYVDDNPKSRRLLTAILEQHGFTVMAAGDSLDEIRRCGEARFDVVLLDYEMPPISGSDLAREIKCKHPDVPIVMICGRTAVPKQELTFVDVHFGPNATLDDLVETMHMLVMGSFITEERLEVATHWADST
jgi:CheY-like chemotaxis protein